MSSSLSKDLSLDRTNNTEAAKKVGELVAKKALAAGIEEVVFDRGGMIYAGKVKALAEAAREAGLKFNKEDYMKRTNVDTSQFPNYLKKL